MRRKFASVILSLTLITIMFVSNNILFIGNAQEMPEPILLPRVYVDFPIILLSERKAKVNVGERFTAFIKAEGFEDVESFQVSLCWEKDKVGYLELRIPSEPPWTIITYMVTPPMLFDNATHGTVAFGVFLKQPLSGNFTIAEIDFICMGPGETTLHIIKEDTFFINSSGREIEYWAYDGVVVQIAPLTVLISPPSSSILIGEHVTFTSSVSGGEPPYSYQWYVNGNPVPDAISDSWTFYPQTIGNVTVYLIVRDSVLRIAKSNDALVRVAPQLLVIISPTSASTIVGQPITFTSNVSGGYPPYSYQWFLNGNPVYGATSNTWTFTPTTSGIFYVHLKVTDTQGYMAQSEASRIIAYTFPVGGYSISIQDYSRTYLLFTYTALLATLTTLLIRTKQKQKR